jgi:hypothetical protein
LEPESQSKNAPTTTSDQDTVKALAFSSSEDAVYESDINTFVRPMLDTVITQFAFKPNTQLEHMHLTKGGWKQIWTDGINTNPNVQTDAHHVYQYVVPVTKNSGYVYNINKQYQNEKIQTLYLRSKYTATNTGLSIEFTKQVVIQGYPPKGTKLSYLVIQAERGDFNDFAVPGYPINQKCLLKDVFADTLLRISIVNGKYIPVENALYIYERTDSID